jgi:glycosyltransferase involved in cell wall biosynthesis
MRVVMLSHAVAPDRLGGLERYVRELSAALVRAGADVTVVAKQLDPAHPLRELGADGVRIHRHPAPSTRSPLYAAQVPLAGVGPVLRATRRGDAIVHGHYVLPTVPMVVAGRPFLYTFHAPMWRELLPERRDRFALPAPARRPAEHAVRALERAVVRRADAVVTLSAFMREEVRGLDPEAGERTILLPGGIDDARFSPGPPGRRRPGGFRLFTARRLTPRTGVGELLRAMVEIRAALPTARLDVAGDGVLREELEREVATLGLGDAVRLLGRIDEDELVRRYRDADLVVMPTQELEGFGLTTAEALACGTPVVATPVGANPELLEPLDGALVADGTDAGAIARVVLGTLADRARLRAARAGARARVSPAMGWDAIAARYLELYARAAG